MPKSLAVVYCHKGPYKGLPEAWKKVKAHMSKNYEDKIRSDLDPFVCYERYLNCPGVTPENELLTEIVFYIKD